MRRTPLANLIASSLLLCSWDLPAWSAEVRGAGPGAGGSAVAPGLASGPAVASPSVDPLGHHALRPTPVARQPRKAAVAHGPMAVEAEPFSRRLIGEAWLYTVRPGDTVRRIAYRFGVPVHRLLVLNGLARSRPLHPGEHLRVSTRHVVPVAPLQDGLLVNEPDNLLYQLHGGKLVGYHKVALGMPLDPVAPAAGTGSAPVDLHRWQTPTGTYRIVDKEANPTWVVPPSIKKTMKDPKDKVPPGPDNPLGKWWLGLDHGGIGIHATNAPWTVGSFSSHGCIRLSPQAAADLFACTPLRTTVQILYQPVKVAVVGKDVYLEVAPDVYAKDVDEEALAVDLLSRIPDPGLVDPERVAEVVHARLGIAERVTGPEDPEVGRRPTGQREVNRGQGTTVRAAVRPPG